MNDSYRISIRAATNGFIVTYSDPEVVKQNRTSNKYKDPDVSVIFKDVDSMTEGIAKLAPLMGAALEKDMDFDQGLVDALTENSAQDK